MKFMQFICFHICKMVPPILNVHTQVIMFGEWTCIMYERVYEKITSLNNEMRRTTCSKEAFMFEQLSKERDNTLSAVLIHIRQVDLITEQH